MNTSETTTAITAIMPVMDLGMAAQRRQSLIDFTKQLMVKGQDYGTVPGIKKPTLFKPGAEKLTTLFGLSPTFEVIDKELDWTGKNHDGEPFFYFQYRCSLSRGDLLVGQGIGNCSSWEKKYRYRTEWTAGKKQQILNPDPAELVNTIDKMAQKRALVAATLIAVNASEFFTQDVEDYSDIIDGEYEAQPPQPSANGQSPQAPKPEPKPAKRPAAATNATDKDSWHQRALKAKTLSQFASAASYYLDEYDNDHHVIGALEQALDFVYDSEHNAEYINYLVNRKAVATND